MSVYKCECGYSDNVEGLPFCARCGGCQRPIEFPIVEIQNELVELCQNWHSGQASAMYSVSSMGLIHNPDILRGLQSELRDVIRTLERPENNRNFNDTEIADKQTAEKWQSILERWEETLPESGEW